MKEKVKLLRLVEEEDYDTGFSGYQEVFDEDKPMFYVSNLTDCPEDAIIGRSLFDAGDWARAVRYGMELAAEGYTDIQFYGRR